MNYMVNARCPGSGETYQSSKAGGIIVWMMFEGGGIYCIDVR